MLNSGKPLFQQSEVKLVLNARILPLRLEDRINSRSESNVISRPGRIWDFWAPESNLGGIFSSFFRIGNFSVVLCFHGGNMDNGSARHSVGGDTGHSGSEFSSKWTKYIDMNKVCEYDKTIMCSIYFNSSSFTYENYFSDF